MQVLSGLFKQKADGPSKKEVLREPMEKREEGRKKYWDLVFNKMKPRWLFAQVASHPLSKYWFIWIDENITTANS